MKIHKTLLNNSLVHLRHRERVTFQLPKESTPPLSMPLPLPKYDVVQQPLVTPNTQIQEYTIILNIISPRFDKQYLGTFRNLR